MSEAQWDDNDSELLLENHNLLNDHTPHFFNSARPNLEGFNASLDRLKTDLEQRRRVDKLDLKKNLEQFESFGQEVEQFTAGVNLEIQQLKLSYEDALQQQFQAQHEKLLEVSTLMSQAGDWETLLNNTVNANTKIRFFRSLIADKPAFKAVGHATRTALFISTYIIAIPYIPC
ncbi:MAG: hypothetical protein F6K56_44330, partial [Moorea sp. SIO3G5]|nr:hypothetical protein [Moorena sp. SIO3G5]